MAAEKYSLSEHLRGLIRPPIFYAHRVFYDKILSEIPYEYGMRTEM